jgi:hypothetical protein
MARFPLLGVIDTPSTLIGLFVLPSNNGSSESPKKAVLD